MQQLETEPREAEEPPERLGVAAGPAENVHGSLKDLRRLWPWLRPYRRYLIARHDTWASCR